FVNTVGFRGFASPLESALVPTAAEAALRREADVALSAGAYGSGLVNVSEMAALADERVSEEELAEWIRQHSTKRR
ncbi:MAG TPA: hypothetical protein VLN59_12010, partial [Burkholderiales bacterium]|nr:hypothetical protein [Burkholderiales bacterium]